MKNSEVVEAFLRKEVAINSTGSLHSTGTKLFSYATCIAQFGGESLIVNTTKYSVTSSKHLSYLKSYLKRSYKGDYYEVKGISVGKRGASWTFIKSLWELR